MGPRAEPSDSIMTPWEKPLAPERPLAFFRDSLVSSCLERGGTTQFIVNRKEYTGQQLALPLRREHPSESTSSLCSPDPPPLGQPTTTRQSRLAHDRGGLLTAGVQQHASQNLLRFSYVRQTLVCHLPFLWLTSQCVHSPGRDAIHSFIHLFRGSPHYPNLGVHTPPTEPPSTNFSTISSFSLSIDDTGKSYTHIPTLEGGHDDEYYRTPRARHRIPINLGG